MNRRSFFKRSLTAGFGAILLPPTIAEMFKPQQAIVQHSGKIIGNVIEVPSWMYNLVVTRQVFPLRDEEWTIVTKLHSSATLEITKAELIYTTDQWHEIYEMYRQEPISFKLEHEDGFVCGDFYLITLDHVNESLSVEFQLTGPLTLISDDA